MMRLAARIAFRSHLRLLRSCASAPACRGLHRGPSRQALPRAPRASLLSELPEDRQKQIVDYLRQVLDKNKDFNLTAVTDQEEALQRHIEDSLALLPFLDHHEVPQGTEATRLVDVGAGAGFPGAIIAAARPDWQVTLLDSQRKKCDFLKTAAAEAGIANVKVLWARAEAAGQDPHLRETFDAVVARAVAELRILAEFCLPLVREGGVWVAAKGAQPEEEVEGARNALEVLGGELEGIHRVESEGPAGPRTAVVVLKAHTTPPKYPRKEGKPKKDPL